jgi:cell division protein FtsB
VTLAIAARRWRITGRALALMLLVGALLVASVYPLRTYLGQRDQIGSLERQERLLERKNAELQTRIGRLHDPAYLERLARECLGMVKRGEISFVLVPNRGARGETAC